MIEELQPIFKASKEYNECGEVGCDGCVQTALGVMEYLKLEAPTISAKVEALDRERNDYQKEWHKAEGHIHDLQQELTAYNPSSEPELDEREELVELLSKSMNESFGYAIMPKPLEWVADALLAAGWRRK